MSLADLFPDGDYRFQMRFERGKPEDFFKPTAENTTLLSQRRHWLRDTPESCAACLPECELLLNETIELAHRWGILTHATQQRLTQTPSPCERCAAFGEIIEPDFLLLNANAGGEFTLRGGCVCFPSSWSLEEKIGRPLEESHGVVPELNEQIGKQIHTFLGRLTPGTAWLRHNWGLSRSPELNQHPRRALPRLEASARIDEVWLRVEHQALVALPQSEGILFGIRITIHPLAQVKADAAAAERLGRALRTMPEPMAVYKNIAAARPALLQMLEASV